MDHEIRMMRLRAGVRSALLVFVVTGAGTLLAKDRLQPVVDRLWIQASDGAVRHRELVAPSKDSLIAMADSVLPYLLVYLETEDARERHTITDLFKGIGSPAVPYLTGVLGTGSDYHTRNTLWALQKIGDASATPAMTPFLGDTLWTIRDQAATSIGACGGPDALPALYGVLNDTQRRVRKSAVVGLGRLNRAVAADSLLAATHDEWFAVRYTAATALVALDSGAVAMKLCETLSPVQLAMVLRAFAESASDAALEAGMRFLTHDDFRVRTAAAFVLEKHEPSNRQLARIKEVVAMETHPLVSTHLRRCIAKWSS